MSDLFTSSAHALLQSIIVELDKAEKNQRHRIIRVSCKTKRLPNGINSCSVQVECDAGCGWLLEDFGNQAGVLEQTATAIQKMLDGEIKDLRKRLSELLTEVVPESIIKARPLR